MARSTVTGKSLLKFDGIPQLIAKLEKMSNVGDGSTGKQIKQACFDAAVVVSNQVRANIQGLNASPELKEVLTATVVTNYGPEDKPNAISAMRQQAAIRKLGKDRSIPNPAWFEYGTVARRTRDGANRGMIQPTPVFRPGVEQARPEATRVLVDGLSKVIFPQK
jgi:hypothetical protein